MTFNHSAVEALTSYGLGPDIAPNVPADLYQLRLLLIQFPKGYNCFLKLNQVHSLRLSSLFPLWKKNDRGLRLFPSVLCDSLGVLPFWRISWQ
jgi:hypothetical protein